MKKIDFFITNDHLIIYLNPRDIEMDEIINSMSNLNLKISHCEICKGNAGDMIHASCPKKCTILCHSECMNKWIEYKRWDASCVKCTARLDLEYIDYILFNIESKNRSCMNFK
jgi:hypothetical protein